MEKVDTTMAVVRRLTGLPLVLAVAMTTASTAAWPQAAPPPGARLPRAVPLERHVPPLPQADPPAITMDAGPYGSDDGRPYGVALSGVILIGQGDAVGASPDDGVNVAAAPQPEGFPILRPRLEEALRPFIGRPLSASVVASLQAAVAAVYRGAGLPFVSVTAPPQEITHGVVHLRVIAFRAATVSVSPAAEAAPAGTDAVTRGVRLRPGEVIDARQLNEDIAWLNRSPFRHVGAVFSPGEATALSNLSLDVTETKPWTLRAGWSNSGSEATGVQRYSVGGGVWLPWANGTTLSYLLTGGDEFFEHPDRIRLAEGRYPRYLSQAAQVIVPTWPRQQIEFTPNLVVSRQDVDPVLSIQSRTFELPVLYRSAVSNLLPGHYWGDVYAGASLKGLSRKVHFAGVEVASGRAGLVQFTIGGADSMADAWGSTAVDLRLEVNPGSTVADSDDAAWTLYTNGRVTRASYAYGIINVVRNTDLPPRLGLPFLHWTSEAVAMIADQPLPDTERMALGGAAGSRGYGFADVAVDRGVIWRNALALPTLSAGDVLPVAADAAPYVFADLAWGQDLFDESAETLGSLGVGVDIAFAGHLSGSLTAGRAMTDTRTVPAGTWTIAANASLTF